jgi:glycosyltransferase involved in cell wall biosynthesis
MATHNGARFIGEQLSSILGQLGPDDEIVISDDSSTDSTVDIINSFMDPRIRLLEGNTFYSPIFNFENALRHATGDIIALSDQDDVWLDNKVAEICRHFNAKPAPLYLVVFDAEVINENGERLYDSVHARLAAGRGAKPGMLNNIFDNTYLGCCMAFSRELLDVALPFPRRIPMHDMWLGLLAELFGKTEFVPVKTMQYRKHSASMTEFRIRFMPWVQIKRRWFLTFSLFVRWIKFRFAGSVVH